MRLTFGLIIQKNEAIAGRLGRLGCSFLRLLLSLLGSLQSPSWFHRTVCSLELIECYGRCRLILTGCLLGGATPSRHRFGAGETECRCACPLGFSGLFNLLLAKRARERLYSHSPDTLFSFIFEAIIEDESHDEDKHLSSKNDGRLGTRSGDRGDSNLKTLTKWKKRCEFGKSYESFNRKEEHVCSENEGRLGNRGSYDEGDPNLKMPSKMKKTRKSIASDGSLDKKDKHVSSEIKGNPGSSRINGKDHCKLKMPCLIEKTQESGKRKDNLEQKEKHVSSENKGRLGNSRSGGEGDCNLKTLSKRNKRSKSGKSNGSLDRKGEHVLTKNEGRLSNCRSYDEGDPNLKMPSKMKKTQKKTESDGSLDKKDKHVSSEIKGKLGSGTINGKGHSKMKMPRLMKKTQVSGKRKENLDKKDQHVSSENKGRLGNSRSGGEGDSNLKTLSKRNKRRKSGKSNGSLDKEDKHVSSEIKGKLGSGRINVKMSPLMTKTQVSGKGKENLDKMDQHVCSENKGRLGNSRSGGEGDCNLKILSKWKKRCESGNSNGSLDRKKEHASSKNEGRLDNSMDQDHAWMNLKKPVGGGTPGHCIGKLFVSNTEIAKRSNGTIVLEGFYEGRSVAVKRLLRAHHYVASQEIRSLTASDGDPNIVRLYGAEYDQDFVYLALERCACSLDDLIRVHSRSSEKPVFPRDPASNAIVGYKMQLGLDEGMMQDVNLWREDGYPSPLLLKLMRDVVSGLVHLHRSGIIHRDLKPQNVLVTKELCAKLSDMGISRLLPRDTSSSEYHVTDCGRSGLQVSEQLCPAQQTSSIDAFGLGRVLFFCVTGGRHPFGGSLKGDSNIEENTMDLSPVEFMPEAADLLARLLNPNPYLRPKALEVLHHPLFWNSKTRLSFLREISDWVKSIASGTNSDLLEKLESIAQRVFDEEWNEKVDCEFIKHQSRFRAYKFKRLGDLLRIVRNAFSHYRELPPKIQEIVGTSPEDLDSYFTKRFPRLLIETYRFVSTCCEDEEHSPFPEYFNP